MPDTNFVTQVSQEIFQSYMSEYDALEMICLSTTDGFPVYNHSSQNLKFDVDTMAAASSTLYSVSNAVSRQILAKHFSITFIESENGNIGFVSLSLADKDYVLSMSASDAMNIGKLRVLINRLSEDLKNTNFS